MSDDSVPVTTDNWENISVGISTMEGTCPNGGSSVLSKIENAAANQAFIDAKTSKLIPQYAGVLPSDKYDSTDPKKSINVGIPF